MTEAASCRLCTQANAIERLSGPRGTGEGQSQKCWMMPKKESFLEEVAFRQGLKDAGVLREK